MEGNDMKTSLEKLERNVKTDRACVLILAIFTALFALTMLFDGLSLMSKEPADFSIQVETNEIFGFEEMNLYIDGEMSHTIYTNYYLLENEDGNTDYRAMAMIEKCRGAVQYTLMTVITVLVYFLFRGCKKMQTPFTSRSVHLLRWIAGLTMAVTLLPELICMVMSMCMFSYAIFEIPSYAYFLLILGAVLGMIAEVFKYGAVLQEDSDSIA